MNIRSLAVVLSLAAISLCTQTTLPALADDGQLKPETATVDDSQNKNQTVPQASPDSVKLYGEVQRRAAVEAFNVAVGKLSRRAQLSADDFRALGVGCTGLENTRIRRTDYARVDLVLEGSPADQAGIRVGEKMIWTGTKATTDNPWQVDFQKAGDPLDVTVIRKGEPVKLTLVAMNVEDLPNPKDRRLWEDLIRRCGYPTGGQIFVGPSMRDLNLTK